MTSARRKGSPKSHPPHPFGDADSKQKLLIEQTDASVARRVGALVDMLAWVRIEMTATHPDGAVTPSDRERLQRALVQLEMALAMTKQRAQLRAQKYRVTWNRIVFAWGKLPKLARLFLICQREKPLPHSVPGQGPQSYCLCHGAHAQPP
jgi:hypothetical protein